MTLSNHWANVAAVILEQQRQSYVVVQVGVDLGRQKQ